MVDGHPLKSIVNLGSASVDNVSSGWQSTMSSRKECNIYIMTHHLDMSFLHKIDGWSTVMPNIFISRIYDKMLQNI